MATRWEADNVGMENAARDLMEEIKGELSLSGGEVSTKMGYYEFLADALFGLIRHSYLIDSTTLFRCFEDALRSRFKQDQTQSDPKKLLSEFDKKCGAVIAKQEKFVLVTSINIKNTTIPRRRVIDGCVLSFSSALPRKFAKHRRAVLDRVKNPHWGADECEDFVFVTISLRAPNWDTAYMRGMEALDLLRSLWQLHIVRPLRFFTNDGNSRFLSASVLQVGNNHTLHLDDGKVVRDAYWYEDLSPKKAAVSISEFSRTDARVGANLSKLRGRDQAYYDFSKRCLLSYVSAIDKSDLEARFTSLWLCLELITGADDAKNIVKRVSFFYADRAIAKATLQSLRHARNSHVHAGVVPTNVGLKNYKMCEFIEHLLVFLLGNPFSFAKPHEIQDFISSATDMRSVEEQIQRLKMVKKFIRPPTVESDT